jgi:hypothetical protein
VAADPNAPGADAFVLVGADDTHAALAAARGLPILAVPRRGGGRTRLAISFAGSRAVPVCLRDQSLVADAELDPRPIVPRPGDEVLARSDGASVWVRRPAGGAWTDITRMRLPDPAEVDRLGLAFRAGGFVPYVPLLVFLGVVLGDRAWASPDSQACFVFDDPNLRRMTYGFVDFRALASHAERHGYHASIATIPMDMHGAADRVAALFRDHADRLSLIVHGNDHTRRELADAEDGASSQAALGQALARAARMEERLRVRVEPIMESPHGVFARSLSASMALRGFEGALVTLDLLGETESAAKLPADAALQVAEPLPGGLCGIPRIRMSPAWPTDAALAALLGQPVVIAGHHYDAKDGLDFLAHMADRLRAMGVASWCSPARLVESAYAFRREGSTLHVRTFSRRCRVPVPGDIREIRVTRAWPDDSRIEAPAIRFASACPGESPKIIEAGCATVYGGGVAEIVHPVRRVNDAPRDPGSRLWPSLRRFITESRDRSKVFGAGFRMLQRTQKEDE